MTIELTDKGIKEVENFLKECQAKRKEILDASKDTALETELPTMDDIIMDIEMEDFIDEEGDYYSVWAVTDNYESDYPLLLTKGVHFEEKK